MKARLAELQADRRKIFRQVAQHVYQILLEFEENNLGRWRKALFGEEQSAAYEMLVNRIAFVEGGRDDLLFLEQYVLLGNYLKDEDRFETFDALMLDFLRETVLTAGSAEEIKRASRSIRNWSIPRWARAKSLRVWKRSATSLSRKLEKGGGMLARVGIGADISQVRAELPKSEFRLKQAQAKLDAAEPHIEAAKNKSDFVAQEYDRVLGDYLNEPENAHRLFDADWPEDRRGRRRARPPCWTIGWRGSRNGIC